MADLQKVSQLFAQVEYEPVITNIRDTQTFLEILETGSPNIRDTQTFLEILEAVPYTGKSDAFVGTDGSIPNIDNWIVDKVSGNETEAKIKDNKLNVKINGGNAKDETVQIKPKYKYDTDFDVTVDYEIVDRSDIDSWSFGFLAVLDKSKKNSVNFGIFRTYNSTDGHEYTFFYESGSLSYTEVTVSTVEMSGTIRLQRVGNAIYGYFWSGTNWTQVGTITHAELGLEAIIHLINESKNSYPDIDVNYNNYNVIIGPATDYWCWHNDIFSGLNNSIPNPDKWLTIGEPVNSSVSIQENKLEIKFTSNDTANTAFIRTDYIFTDFDIQVDFTIISSDSQNYWNVGMMCYQLNGWYSGIYRSYNSGANGYYAYRYNGSLVDTNAATSDASGKLRFVRSGTTWTWYYWNTSTKVWTQLRTEAVTSGDADMRVYIMVESMDNTPDANVIFDNFIVNSGCPTQSPGYTYGRMNNITFINL